MENASKALIIAGAILIAIILISVGIIVINGMSSPVDQVSSEGDSMAAQIFNAKFQKFFGKNKTGSEVKQMISQMLIHDSNDKNHLLLLVYYEKESGSYVKKAVGHEPTDRKTTIKGMNDIYNRINDSTKYTIEVTSGCGHYNGSNGSGGYTNDGYIGCISIKKQ